MVRSGSEALREILQREFAVILLDVNMPDIDGLETGAPDPAVQEVGAHADHLHHRLRRRDADRAGLLARRGGLHPLAGDPRRAAQQGARVRRPLPDAAAHPRHGRASRWRARGPRPRARRRKRPRGARTSSRARATSSAPRSTSSRACGACSTWWCRRWPRARALVVDAESAIGRCCSTRRSRSNRGVRATARCPSRCAPRCSAWCAKACRSRARRCATRCASASARSAPWRWLRTARSPQDLVTLQELVGRAAIALDNARLYSSLQREIVRSRAGRGAAAGREPAQGRVPRHAVARAAQPARADPQRGRGDPAPRAARPQADHGARRGRPPGHACWRAWSRSCSTCRASARARSRSRRSRSSSRASSRTAWRPRAR